MERMGLYLRGKILEREKRSEADRIIAEFIEENNIKLTEPIDICKLATRLGFDVRPAVFKEKIDGILYVDKSIEKIARFNSNKVIVYNIARPVEDASFIIAHELCHYIKSIHDSKSSEEKTIIAARDRSDTDYSSSDDEQFIDYMAAALLIPTESLNAFLEKNMDADATLVASKYDVGKKLAERRIQEVNLKVTQ